jgi:hypothetical protein
MRRKMKRKTIRLADGYNGDTILLFADAIETEGHLLKLQCAEPGRGYLFRWASKEEVSDGLKKMARERANRIRRERDQIRRDCGLTRVVGALGGVYWE